MSAGVHASAGETSGKAIASLVLGIGGFVIFPVVLSILAIVFGRSAKREIARASRARRGRPGHRRHRAGLGRGGAGRARPCCSIVLVVVASTSTSTG